VTPERATSVTRVFDVLVATFPGQPTDQAVDEVQQEVLNAMDAIQPRGVILDISAVTTMDSFFARVISETAGMVSMMGGETIVVGTRPSVAITAAELGFNLDEVATARNTDHALSLLGISVDETATVDKTRRKASETATSNTNETPMDSTSPTTRDPTGDE
jgi:rsbT antagonist protein RsbS